MNKKNTRVKNFWYLLSSRALKLLVKASQKAYNSTKKCKTNIFVYNQSQLMNQIYKTFQIPLLIQFFLCKFHLNRNSLHNFFFGSKFRISRENPCKCKLRASHPIGGAACDHVVKFVFLITALSRASKNIRRHLVINSYPSQP